VTTKRPALSAILGAGKPIEMSSDTPGAPALVGEGREPAPAKSAAPPQRKATRKPVRPARKAEKVSRRAAGHVQLNVLLPANLRKQAKVKALQEDRDLSEVIETLLKKWVGV